MVFRWSSSDACALFYTNVGRSSKESQRIVDAYSAAQWCTEALAEWESINQELMEIRFADTNSSSILHKARIKRAEEKLAASNIKAAAATLVQQLMHDSDRGSVTLEVPGILDVKLTWNERLPTNTE